MQTLGKYFKIFFIFLYINLISGEITLEVDKKEIKIGDILILKLTIISQKKVVLPNINFIDKVPTRLIDSYSTSLYKFEKNKNIKYFKLENYFRLKINRDLIIKPFIMSIDGVIKKTELIKVVCLNKKINEDSFLLKNKIEKKNYFLNQPFIFTIILNENLEIKNLLNSKYIKPEFKDFTSKRLFNGKNSEITYLLIPNKTGILKIDSAFLINRYKTKEGTIKSKIIYSKPLEINITKSPYDIFGNYDVKTSIDINKTEANKPIQLNIEISGEGSLDNFEGVDFNILNVTFYKSDMKISTSIKDGKLFSRYSQKFVFMSNNNFTIPIQKFYTLGNKKYITTKSFNITVLNSKESYLMRNKHIIEELSKTKNVELDFKEVLSTIFNKNNNIYFFLTGFLLSFIILFPTLLREIKNWNIRKLKFKNFYKNILNRLLPHINKNIKIEKMATQIYKKNRGDKNIKIDKKLLNKIIDDILRK